MTTKKYISLIAFVLVFLFSACETAKTDDILNPAPASEPTSEPASEPVESSYRVADILYPSNAKLKSVYQVNTNNKKLWEAYSYDNLGRISRIDHNPTNKEQETYRTYQYNTNGELEKISYYRQADPDTPVALYQTVEYAYDTEGNKIKETHPTSLSLFYYDDENRCIKKETTYQADNLTAYTTYEYAGDKLIKEKFCTPEGEVIWLTDHTYKENLLVYSITHREYPASIAGLVRDATRYYDRNDHLIRVVENDAMLSSNSETAVRLTWEYAYE
jgi:uncharacterized lipoprotein YehR (DUF1307 family)